MQGLGFSNLIYLHMRLEEFYKSVDDSKVNVFFIEEPESHMHPQMQNVFIRFLTKYYTEKKLQGLITTHSNEIARSVGLNSLRVIRQTEKSKSELFNLSKFRKSIENKKVMKISDLTAETHNKNEANKKLLAEYSNQVLNTYRDNKLFEALLKDDFIAYLAKSTVGNAKNIFKISKIEGILTAYKLFYVGCSRARKNLVIVVDETKINKFENEFKAKLISIGFEIQGFPMQETATV